jgi:hypothetical protein
MKKLEIRGNESQLKKDHNYLPYETPRLRKHGKVNDMTKSAFISGPVDGFLGPGFLDLS